MSFAKDFMSLGDLARFNWLTFLNGEAIDKVMGLELWFRLPAASNLIGTFHVPCACSIWSSLSLRHLRSSSMHHISSIRVSDSMWFMSYLEFHRYYTIWYRYITIIPAYRFWFGSKSYTHPGLELWIFGLLTRKSPGVAHAIKNNHLHRGENLRRAHLQYKFTNLMNVLRVKVRHQPISTNSKVLTQFNRLLKFVLLPPMSETIWRSKRTHITHAKGRRISFSVLWCFSLLSSPCCLRLGVDTSEDKEGKLNVEQQLQSFSNLMPKC